MTSLGKGRLSWCLWGTQKFWCGAPCACVGDRSPDFSYR